MLNVLFTGLLFLLSFGILFFNEDKTVRQKISLEEATADIVSLPWHQPFQKQYVGRVVHIAGPLNTGEPLTEPDYNIQVQAVKLRRRVSMYQWVEETVERIGSNPHPQDVMDHDERQYFYSMEWRETLVDSTHFYLRSGHQNPPNFPFQGQTQVAEHVRIGEYELNEKIKSSFNNYVLITSDTRPDIQGVKLHSGFYYHTDDIHEPKVGDMRLQFQLAGLESTSYSVVGQLNESGIVEPFRSRVGHELLILKPGDVSIEEIMSQERFTLNVKSWVTRALGTAILFMALSKLLDVLTKYRFQGSAANLSRLRSFRFTSVRLCFAMATSVLLVSLVWSLHKPLTGFGLFLGSVILYLFSLKAM